MANMQLDIQLPPVKTAFTPGKAQQQHEQHQPNSASADPALQKALDLQAKASRLQESIQSSRRYSPEDKADEAAALALIRARLQGLEVCLRVFSMLRTPKNKPEALRNLHRARKEVLAAARECLPHVVQSTGLITEVLQFTEMEQDEPVSPCNFGIEWHRQHRPVSHKDQGAQQHATPRDPLASSMATLFFGTGDVAEPSQFAKQLPPPLQSEPSDDIRPSRYAAESSSTMCNIESALIPGLTGTGLLDEEDSDEVSSKEDHRYAGIAAVLHYNSAEPLRQQADARNRAAEILAARHQARPLPNYSTMAVGGGPVVGSGDAITSACYPLHVSGGSRDQQRYSYGSSLDGSERRTPRRRGRNPFVSLVRGVVGVVGVVTVTAALGIAAVFAAAAVNQGLDDLERMDGLPGVSAPARRGKGHKAPAGHGDDFIPEQEIQRRKNASLLALSRG